jgi:hypothetical protein
MYMQEGDHEVRRQDTHLLKRGLGRASVDVVTETGVAPIVMIGAMRET